MNFQCIFLDDDLIDKFSPILQDLAGNAFNGGACAQACTLQLVVASVLAKCVQSKHKPTMVVKAIEVPVEEDSDDELDCLALLRQ